MNPQSPPRLLKLCGLLAVLLSAASAVTVSAQPTPSPTTFQVEAPPVETSTQATEFILRWETTPGVRRDRLQVPRDPTFFDIVIDGAVDGLEHRVIGLPPGHFNRWVAPTLQETGRFRQGEAVEPTVLADTSITSLPSLVTTPRTAATPVRRATTIALRSPVYVGWQAATGEVQRPVPPYLRAKQQFDLVAFNYDGTVYALKGANGAALRTVRYRRAIGRLVWWADDGGKVGTSTAADNVRPLRSLSVATVSGSGSALIVSDEKARGTVRAAGMPSVAAGAAAR
jgi:hypothetical protein